MSVTYSLYTLHIYCYCRVTPQNISGFTEGLKSFSVGDDWLVVIIKNTGFTESRGGLGIFLTSFHSNCEISSRGYILLIYYVTLILLLKIYLLCDQTGAFNIIIIIYSFTSVLHAGMRWTVFNKWLPS